MFESVINFIDFLRSLAYITLIWSWRIGHIIVSTVQTLWGPITQLFKTIFSGITVLFEDFTLFTSDLGSKLSTAFVGTVEGIESAAETTYGTVELVQNFVTTCKTGVFTGVHQIWLMIEKVWLMIISLLYSLKYFIILVGSGVWFAVTFIPLTLTHMCVTIFYFITSLLREVIDISITTICGLFWFVIDVCNFVLDVPVESIIGLIIGSCIAYVFIKCHVMLYGAMSIWVKKIAAKIKKKLTRPPVSSPPGKNGSCIICFERNRCVVTMPCRHLCMCDRCWERLEEVRPANDLKCPVCRTKVRNTIQVY